MRPEISLITIFTDDVERMKNFYTRVLGFKIKGDLGVHVEFENKGVRFAICARSVMYSYSDEYRKKAEGQSFELAFSCDDPDDVDVTYNRLIELGATPVHEPANMPWNQRTALFADPDGDRHDIFADIV